jgi:hypothetical protein
MVNIQVAGAGSKKLSEHFMFPVGSSPAELRRRIETDAKNWIAVGKAAGIQPQ